MSDPVLSDFGNFVLEHGGKGMTLHRVMRDTYDPESNPQVCWTWNSVGRLLIRGRYAGDRESREHIVFAVRRGC